MDLQTSYNRVAAEYVARIAGELAHKPLDRHILNWFGERVHGLGQVCDVGCGPGHVTRYLHTLGVPVCGLDLSKAMILHAKQFNPELSFMQGNMRSLGVGDSVWGGIVAFYSIIHIPRDEVVSVLREFKRVLRPGGALLLAFHIGQQIIHLDEWWDQPVALDFVFFQPGEMTEYLSTAGFEIEVVVERTPYIHAEHPSRRAYICAGKPAQPHSV